jgi:hypothetical protein
MEGSTMKKSAVLFTLSAALLFIISTAFAQEPPIPNLQGTWTVSGKETKTGVDGKKHTEVIEGVGYIYQKEGPYDPLIPNVTLIMPTEFRDIAIDGFVRGKLVFFYWIEEQINIPGEQENEWEGRTMIGTVGKNADSITWTSVSFDSGTDMDIATGKGNLKKTSDSVPARQ